MTVGDDIEYYNYLQFNTNGIYYGYTRDLTQLARVLDTVNGFENYFIFKKGYLRWEVYQNSLNGYNLYKAKSIKIPL